MVAAGGVAAKPGSEWPQVDSMEVLGAQLQQDAHIGKNVDATMLRLWRAFVGSVVCSFIRSLNANLKLRLVSRTLRPCLEIRKARWPMSSQVLRVDGSAQRKMISIVLTERRRPGEESGAFTRRRARAVTTLIRKGGDAECWQRRHVDRCHN